MGRYLKFPDVLEPGFLRKFMKMPWLSNSGSKDYRSSLKTPLLVNYKGETVGEYFPDLLVEGQVIVEIKAVERLHPIHTAQILNYLKATAVPIGLLVNFVHPKAIIKRYVNKFSG